MKYKFVFYLLFILLSLAQTNGRAADDNIRLKKVSISEKNMEKYRKDDVFNYEPVKKNQSIIEKIFEKIKNWIEYIFLKLFSWLFGVKKGGMILQYIIKALPYLAILLFVYLIFKFLLGVDLIRLQSAKNNYPVLVNLSDDEKIIKEQNPDELIQMALAKNDYRLAVRYQYLKILKILIDKGIIEWHPDKTNRDYIKEINLENIRNKFSHLTFIYDYVWYGNFFPDRKEYEDIEMNFIDFQAL